MSDAESSSSDNKKKMTESLVMEQSDQLQEALKRKSASLVDAHVALHENMTLLSEIHEKIEVMYGVFNSGMRKATKRNEYFDQVNKILTALVQDEKVSSLQAEAEKAYERKMRAEAQHAVVMKNLEGAVGRQTEVITNLVKQDDYQRKQIDELSVHIQTLRKQLSESQTRHLAKVEEFGSERSSLERKIQHLEIRNDALNKANSDLQEKVSKLTKGSTIFL
eukprot:CAMPEP_0184492746 /NCGR_PEP_ID=MMETSP0113_2-20130426/24147_1 /TAXON_ID=91329 /ORGANISM="Norrisiella sphaerica, Strain BC52" /LENGTH=220 /DNA_ID=CAMNT_0026877719 /DNA_START=241 /DNA_END=903 /DNA_ORIENTATION=-